MNRVTLAFLFFVGSALHAVGQSHEPIYRVTVERRSIQAVNYGQQSSPTKIDFRGTVLLPSGKGEAKVQGKGGAVDIDAKFEGLEAPSRFGPSYLTYVLWAITPEGRPVNLGEILPDASNKAHLKVTAAYQAFGLLVTAEPYFSVTQPSNVVVLENALRPDTVGQVKEVEAHFELLHRSDYPAPTVPVEAQATPRQARALSMDRYQAVLALYEAQNAMQLARAQGADRYAQSTLQKAQQLYDVAQQLDKNKNDSKRVVTIAREAAQTAEDARAIAMRREPNH